MAGEAEDWSGLYNPPLSSGDSPTWGDYGQAVKSGANKLLAGAAGVARWYDETTGDKTSASANAIIEKQLGDFADENLQNMSPEGRKRLEASFFSKDFLSHPLSSALLKGAQMSPGLVAAFAPGGLMADAAVGTAIGAASFGTMNLADSVDNIYKVTDSLPDDKLREQFPFYDSLRSMGMDEEDARAQANAKLRGLKPWINFAVGAAAGALGPVGGAVRGAAGKAAASTSESVLSRAGAGAAEGAIGMGAQSGVGDYTTQAAQLEAGSRNKIDVDQLVSAVLEGAVMGGVPGGALGAMFKGHGEGKSDTPSAAPKGYGTGNQAPPRVDVALGNPDSAPTRSDIRYPKGNQSGEGGSIETTQVLGPDADQAAAMQKEVSRRQDILAARQQFKNEVLPEQAPPQPPVQDTPPGGAGSPVVSAQPQPVEQPPRAFSDTAPAPVAPKAPPTQVAPNPEKPTSGLPTGSPKSTPAAPTGKNLDALVKAASEQAMRREIVETPMPSGANSSKDMNGPVYVDPSVPEPLRRPVAVHETVEQALMARGMPYEKAHIIATKAEKQAVEAAGMNWEKYTHQWDGLLDHIEKEKYNPATAPQDLHVDPEAAIGHHSSDSKGVESKGVVTEPAPAPTTKKGRVLEDVTPEGKAAREEYAQQEREQAQQVNVENAKASQGEKPVGTKHRTKEEVEQRASNETNAQQIVERHPSTQGEADDAVLARAKSMVEEAKQHGVEIKKALKGEVTPAMAMLREAADLVRATETKKWPANKKYRTDALSRFRAREGAARSGAVDEVLAERRSEGDTAKRVAQGDVESVSVTPQVIEGAGGGTGKRASVVGSETKVGDGELRGVSAGREVVDGVERQKASPVRKVELSDEQKADILKKHGANVGTKTAEVKERVQANKPDVIPEPKADKPKTIIQQIKDAADNVETKPTTAQKEAGNYAKGHINLHGLDITIENSRGSERSGVGPDGKPWSVNMPDHYGYIKRTEGADGDHVDVTVGKYPESKHAFVIDQVNADTRQPDEHKTFLGYNNASQVLDAYERSFSDGRAAERVGAFHAMSVDEFKEWLKKGDTKAPLEAASPSAVSAARASQRAKPGDVTAWKSGESATPVRTMPLSDFIQKLDLRRYGPLFPFIRGKLKEGAGDVKVHLFEKNDLNRLAGQEVDGYYSNSGEPGGEWIGINADLTHAEAVRAAIHEGVHALTIEAINKKPLLRFEIRSLMDEVAASNNGLRDTYAWTNEAEFIAEAMGNESLQNTLRQTAISRELAQRLGLRDWRKYSLWSAFVEKVRQLLRLPGNTYSALEGALSLTERASVERLDDDAFAYHMNQIEDEHLGPAGRVGDIVPDRSRRISAALSVRDSVEGAIKGAKEAAGNLAAHPVDTMVSAVKSVADKPDASAGLRHLGWKLTTNDQFGQRYAGIMPQARPIFQAIERQSAYSNELKKPGTQLTADMLRAVKADPESFQRFARLINDQTMYGVDASAAIGTGRNAYLALSKDNLAKQAKGTFKPSDANSAHWGAHGAYPELTKEYQALTKAHPEYKELQERLFKYFEDTQHEMVRGHIEDYLRAAGVDEARRPAMAEDMASAKPTADFKAQLEKDHGGVIAKQILDAKKLAGSEGPYSPLQRHGDYVVAGKYKIAEPTNAVNKPNDHTWEFKTREDAHKFAEGTGLAYDAGTVYYDPATGERTTKLGGLSATGSAEQRWEVNVQRNHVEFHDSIKDAQKAQAELHATGLLEDKPYVEAKQDYIARGNDIGAGALKVMQDRLERTTEFQRASPAQQADMRKSLQEVALATRAGNRIQSRQLPRRRVQGASDDLPRTLWIHNEAQAAYRAKIKYRPQVEDMLEGMHKYVADQRAADPDNTLLRSEVSNEVTQRARAQDPSEYVGAWSDWSRRVMTWSYIDRMMRASHLILHQTHLPMITAPIMSGRHGALQTYATVLRTWKQAVRAYKAGALDTQKSFFDGMHQGTDYQHLMTDSFAKYEDGGNLARMFQELADRNIIHPQSGIEIGKFQPSRQLGGAIGKLDNFMNHMDTIFRHATNATEAINRYVGAASAYRLEYSRLVAKGMDADKAHAAATNYAGDTIANTQGLFSPTNAAPLFKNKFLRPFLQFKQFPQMMYHLLISNAAKVLKGATKEERVQAAASLATILSSHVLMTGLLGGLPLEAAKVTGMVTKGLGITDSDWNDVERATYEKAVDMFGKEGADYVMHGVSRHLFGVDLHHRLGLNSFFTFGLPEKLDKKSVSTFLFDQAIGAPEGLAEDTFNGIHQMLGGDIMGGAAKAFPSQALRDVQRAWAGGTAKHQYTPGETVARVLGFTPTGEATQGERAAEMTALRADYTERRTSLISKWVTGGDKASAWAQIQRFNAQYPHEAGITMAQLHQALSRKASAKTYGGVTFNNQNRWIEDRDRALYP